MRLEVIDGVKIDELLRKVSLKNYKDYFLEFSYGCFFSEQQNHTWQGACNH